MAEMTVNENTQNTESSNAFKVLYGVNVNAYVEKKKTGNTELSYVSWPFAWAEVKKRFPDASYEIEKFNGLPYAFDPATGYMVYTTVTIEGITHEMWLPVMDGANKAMRAEPYTYTVKNPNFKWAKEGKDGKFYDKYGNEQPEYFIKSVDAATMFDINKTIMRCLVKNLAMFGLGLYIYAGEDLPFTEEDEKKAEQPKTDADRAKESYPPFAIMVQSIEAVATEKQLSSWLQKAGVNSLSDAPDEQVMALYRWYESKGAFRND